MDKLLKRLTIVLSLVLFYSFAPTESKNMLTVNFENIRNNDGKIFIFIYNYENQYPDNPYLYFEINKTKVANGELRYVVPEGLQDGQYAISVIDDENANEDLDLFLGIPTEGYGFSNNVAPYFSMPDYNDLLFDFSDGKKTINLTLQYIL